MMAFCRKEGAALLTALAFLSRLAPACRLEISALSASVRYFAVAGLCIGAVQVAAPALLLCWRPDLPLFAAWLYVAGGFVVTRGLHWDAVADMGDAWGSGAEGEAFWRVLKDSRMGAYGGMSLLLTFSLLACCVFMLCAAGNWLALALAPAWGRLCGTLLAGAAAPRSAAQVSLGGMACAGATRPVCWVSAVLGGLAVFCWLPPPAALALCVCSAVLGGALRGLAVRQGGLNGDFLGAGILWCECLALCAACL